MQEQVKQHSSQLAFSGHGYTSPGSWASQLQGGQGSGSCFLPLPLLVVVAALALLLSLAQVSASATTTCWSSFEHIITTIMFTRTCVGAGSVYRCQHRAIADAGFHRLSSAVAVTATVMLMTCSSEMIASATVAVMLTTCLFEETDNWASCHRESNEKEERKGSNKAHLDTGFLFCNEQSTRDFDAARNATAKCNKGTIASD